MKDHPIPFLACLPLAAVITAVLFALATSCFRLEAGLVPHARASHDDAGRFSAYNPHAYGLAYAACIITSAPGGER